MKKNGKIIQCKTCNREFYVSASRVGTKKYCSTACAYKDNYGFKPRPKTCVVCNKEFIIHKNIELQKKTCCYKCQKQLRDQISSRRTSIKIVRVCELCKKEFLALKYNILGKLCKCCQYKKMKNRINDKNPNFRGGIWSKDGLYAKDRSTNWLHQKACAKYKKSFLEKHLYLFCEVCGVNSSLKFSTHHIYYASRYPRHPELHNFRNLIMLCHNCHTKFHAEKHKEIYLELEIKRGLKELFI